MKLLNIVPIKPHFLSSLESAENTGILKTFKVNLRLSSPCVCRTVLGDAYDIDIRKVMKFSDFVQKRLKHALERARELLNGIDYRKIFSYLVIQEINRRLR